MGSGILSKEKKSYNRDNGKLERKNVWKNQHDGSLKDRQFIRVVRDHIPKKLESNERRDVNGDFDVQKISDHQNTIQEKNRRNTLWFYNFYCKRWKNRRFKYKRFPQFI